MKDRVVLLLEDRGGAEPLVIALRAQWDYEAIEASDASEAIRLVETHAPRLLLLDLSRCTPADFLALVRGTAYPLRTASDPPRAEGDASAVAAPADVLAGPNRAFIPAESPGTSD